MRLFSLRRLRTQLIAVVLVMVLAGVCYAGSAPAEEKTKHGILVVAFGSSMPEGQVAVNAVIDSVKLAYPKTEVRLAYTSRIIMRKLAKESGMIIDEPAVALAKMAFDGFTDVAVMSTHIIPGAEYQDLEAVVNGFKLMTEHGTKAGFKYITLSEPLFANQEDFERAADILTKTYAKEGKSGAVVFVGHGTHHFADTAYSALQMAFARKSPNFFVGTVEGLPDYKDVLSGIKKRGLKKVTIAPAMLVAGDHAHNDIAGDEDDSWKVMLTKEKFTVTPKLVGLGQNEGIKKMLLDKLGKAWGEHAPK